MTSLIPRIKKALAAATTAGILFYAKAVGDGFTTEEIGQLVAVVISTGVVVYLTPKNVEA